MNRHARAHALFCVAVTVQCACPVSESSLGLSFAGVASLALVRRARHSRWRRVLRNVVYDAVNGFALF
jgi:hypothetical protein